jgi:multisubunit Na+/H+ antiporter MnhG subunit
MARKRKSEARQASEFALVLSAMLGLLGALGLWRGHPRTAVWLVAVIPVVLAVAFVLPAAWLRLFRLWMLFGKGMSWVTTRILLAIVFYLLITPFGWAMRLAGKRPLDLAWRDGKPSYWIDKTETPRTLERYEKQF